MAVSNFYPTQQSDSNYGNLPSWIVEAMKKVGEIGPGAASRVGFSGPQDFASLVNMYQQTLGTAPTEVGESRIRSLYDDAIKASMELGGEQIQASAGDRGAAVGGGVQRQQARDLALKVQTPLTESILNDASKGIDRKTSNLGALFGSASGPQTTDLSYRNNATDINSQLPPYVQQSQPGAGGESNSFSDLSGGGKSGKGAAAGSGGGAAGTPWWQTSYGDMNAGAGAAYNEKNSKPGSLTGWNPGGVAGGSGLELNLSAGETPTGGGGHGLENIYAANAPSNEGPSDEYNYFEVYGPERSGRSITKERYNAAGGAYDFYRQLK